MDEINCTERKINKKVLRKVQKKRNFLKIRKNQRDRLVVWRERKGVGHICYLRRKDRKKERMTTTKKLYRSDKENVDIVSYYKIQMDDDSSTIKSPALILDEKRDQIIVEKNMLTLWNEK